MGKKGTPHRKWSKEEKLHYIHLHLDEHQSVREIERKYGVGSSLVSAWVKRYMEDGEEALEAKNGSVLFHDGNLLFHFIFCFEGLCFFLVLCPSLCLNYSRDRKRGLAHKQTM